MRRIAQLALSLAVLATQVNVPQWNFGNVAAADPAPVSSASVYEVNFNTATAQGVELASAPRPNYNSEVLAPLHTAEAVAAAREAAQAAARERYRLVVRRAPVVIATGDVWGALRLCEAGGDYTRNSGNGYYGAYQFSLSSWGDFMGYARPDLAPPPVQDAKAHATEATRGWAPWPACARRLGLY